MRFIAAIPLILLAGGGCAMPPGIAPRRATVTENHAAVGDESPRTSRPTSPPGAPATAKGDPVALAAYEVRESAFTDFGMSVKTNLAVKWGDSVEWMEVSGVEPESSAAKQNLRPGDRILAIDGQVITKFSRDSMLEVLFQRKAGDRSEVLVLGPTQALPRYVILTAERPRLAN